MLKNKLLGSIVFLPTSKTISYWWNLGSLLGFLLGLQLLRGILLVFYYGTEMNFDSVQYIMYEVRGGWLMRVVHFNGASFFFLCLYLHVFKGIFLPTKEGDMRINLGDWIATGEKGEHWAIKDDIFRLTYELVED